MWQDKRVSLVLTRHIRARVLTLNLGQTQLDKPALSQVCQSGTVTPSSCLYLT